MGIRERNESIKKPSPKTSIRERNEKKKRKSQYESTIGFDTLDSDLSSLSETIKGAYEGWQTQETMKNTKSAIESMHNRLTTYQDYRKTYGITDGEKEFNELVGAYKTELDGWDELTSYYGGFKDADAYKRGQAEAKRIATRNEKMKTDDLAALQTEIADAEKELSYWENLAKNSTTAIKINNGGKNTSSYADWTIPSNVQNANNKKAVLGEDAKKGSLNPGSKYAGKTIKELQDLIADKKTYLEEAQTVQANIQFSKDAKSGKGKLGIEKWYEDKAKSDEEKEKKKAEEGFFDDFLTRLKKGEISETTAFIGRMADIKAEDTSYQEPKDDWTQDELYEFGARYFEDPEVAFEYAANLNNEKVKEEKGKKKQKAKDFATKNAGTGTLATIGSIPAMATGLYDIFDDYTDWYAGRKVIVEEPTLTPFEWAQTSQGAISEKLNEYGTLPEHIAILGGKGWGDLYGLGTSVMQSLATTTTGGPLVTAVTFFGQGAASAVDEATERGATIDEALAYGTVVGAAEMVSEYIGAEKLMSLGSKDVLKSAFRKFLEQSGAEGLEETFSAVIDNIADDIIMGEKSKFHQLVKQYKLQGLSEEDAINKAWIQTVEEIAYNGVSGFASGGIHTMAMMPVINHEHKKTGAKIRDNERINDMLDVARLSPEESEAYAAYTKYAKKGTNADNISNLQLGKMFSAAGNDVSNVLKSKKATDEQIANAFKTKQSLDDIIGNNETQEEKAIRQRTKELAKPKAKGVTINNIGEIKGIKVGKDNTIITNEGEKPLNEVELSETNAELVAHAETIANTMGEDVANVFLSQYNEEINGSVSDYALSFNLTTEYAKKNMPLVTMLENKGVLTEKQVGAIHTTTIAAMHKATENAKIELTEKHSQKTFLKGRFDDSIIDRTNKTTDGSKVNWNSLTPTQRSAIRFAELFSKATGVNIKFKKSEVVNGIHKGENGSYNPATNTIEIDVYAGRIDAKVVTDSIIPTLSHELTHWMKAKSLNIYNSIREDVLKTLSESSGQTTHELIAAEMQRMKKAHSDMEVTPDDAIDELVARACEDMLSNSNEARKLLNRMSQSEQQNFIEKVKETFENLIKWVNDLLAHYKSNSAEAKTLQEYKHMLKKISKQWDAMLVDAIKTNQALQHEGIKAEDIISKDVEAHKIQLNERLVEKHIDMLENNYSEDATLPLDTLLARYNKIVDIWKKLGGELNSQFLEDWNNKVGTDRTFSVFKAQAGYKYNVELSSMCKKGIPLFEAIDKIVKDEAMKELRTKNLGKAEKEILYDILKENNFDIPCAICYVEQARQNEGKIIDNFLDGFVEKSPTGKTLQFKLGWNETLDNIQKEMKAAGFDYTFPSLDRSVATDNYSPADLTMDEETQGHFFEALKKVANKEIQRYNKEQNKGKPKKLITKTDAKSINEVFKGKLPLNLMMFKTMFNEASSRFKIDNDLLYSSMTTQNLARNHNGLYSVFNAQGGVGGYKTKQGTVVYWGDILKKTWQPSKLRDEGGVRNQSNSDFLMYTLLDHAQMYIDFTAKGYYLQAYTKVLSELKLFGLSKGKINASFIPKVHVYKNADGSVDVEKTQLNAGLDENGNPIFDDVEGIPHDEAFMLVEDGEYSKSIGGVCIGYSDNHISKLLDDNRIQLIIGFHDKTNDTSKRYKGAVYATNYNGRNEATKLDKDGKLKTVHLGFNQFVRKAENKFKNKDSIEYNGKTYKYNDIPKLAADLYIEHCENKGLFPDYSQGGTDFSKHPNYYKLLAVFSLYDINGNYAPHQKVEYNMPDQVPYLDENGKKAYMSTEDYIKKELKGELAVRDAISEKLADKSENGIIPQFIERANALHDSKNIKHSDRDSRGNELSEGQQKFFAESKFTDEQGNLLRLYHGTENGGFTKFNAKYSDDGITLFLTPSRELANTYTTSDENVKLPEGKKGLARLFETGTGKGNGQAGIYEVYANAKNPYILDGKGANWESLPFNEKIKGKTKVDTENTFDYQNYTLTTKVTIDGKTYEKVFDLNHLVEAANAEVEELSKRSDVDKKDLFWYELSSQAENELLEYYQTLANEKIAKQLMNYSTDTIDIQDGLTRTESLLIDNETGRGQHINTRFVSKWAKENGYDGVWFKNIYDAGGKSEFQGENAIGDVIVVFDGSQIKSVDNLNPTKNKDIRYADRDYSYDALTSKPDMVIPQIANVPSNEISLYMGNRNLFAKEMIAIATKAGNSKNTNTATYLHCKDLNEDVQVTKNSFKHGAARMDAAYIAVCKNISNVLENSIVVNELKEKENTNGGYVLLGLAESEDSYIIVRSIVDKKTWKLEDYNELYAIRKKSIKKEDVGFIAPALPSMTGFGTSSTISITNFLKFVNNQKLANSVLSMDVINRLNSKREFDKNVTPNLLYSDRDSVGNTLTNEQIEFFKDSKVRDKNGNLLTVRHGTSEDFHIFDFAKSGKNGKAEGYGFYFSDDAEITKAYGDIQKEVYLNITKPLYNTKRTVKKAELTKLVNALIDFDKSKWGTEWKDSFISNYVNTYEFQMSRAYAVQQFVNQIWEYNDNDQDLIFEVAQADGRMYENSTMREFYDVLTKSIGYDGIIAEWSHADGKSNVYVTFNSEQSKYTSNKTPTSNPDMRFSDRDNVSVYDKIGEVDKLIKENEMLKEDVEMLKERLKLEGKVTHGEYFNQNQLNAVAGHIRSLANSSFDKKTLASLIDGIYKYISHSEDLNWQDMYAQCYDVARMVLDEAKPVKVKNDYNEYVLKEISGATLYANETQIKEAEYKYGKHWRNKLKGRFKITDNPSDTSIDTMWTGWSSAKDGYPNIFDASETASSKLASLIDAVESLREATEIVEEYDIEEQTRSLAYEIYNKFWTVQPIRTTADKYTKQIKQLNFKHRQAMDKLRADRDAKLQAQHKFDKQKANELYKNLRERKDKEIAEIKKLGKERMDAYKENAERKTKIQSITANALTLNKWLTKNSKEHHIHEAMKGPVINLLQSIDFSSKQLLGMKGSVIERRGTPTRTDISFSKALSQVKDMMADASVGKEELIELYGHGLNDEIKELVDSVDNMMRTVGDNEFILNKMSLDELQTLDKIVNTIKHSVSKMNKFHTVNHTKGIVSLSQEQIEYADSLGKEKVFDPKTLKAGVQKLVKWDNKTPFYAFKQFGKAGQKIFEAFQDGWDKLSFNAKKIIDFAKETYTNKEVIEWTKEIKTFDVRLPATDMDLANPDYKPKYKKVQMTTPQIMSLYCSMKREQAKNHILQGGIRVADITMKNGRLIQDADGITLTASDITNIVSALTPRQKQVADALQKFMNNECAAWGNEVSMIRFGYKAFGEDNYFPIESDANNLTGNDAPQENGNSLFKLLNMSFTKNTVEGANNRIVIKDIFDVFASHSSDMAKYNALALPVLDANRWYNYTEKIETEDERFITKSVKASIENAFGKEGKKYFTTFLEDINGQKNVGRDTLGKEFFSRAKIVSVAANMRVAMLQPTAYLKASAIMNNKYLTKAFLHKPKIKHAEKYCGMALWKSLGYYDTDISKGLTEQIKHAETWKDKAVEMSMKGAEWGDKITFGYLWNACELEIRDTRKDLKVGSEEFYDTVAKRLREVIYATQVVDSTMTRSQLMRSGNMYEKMLTAFSSEPTLAFNMLQDAVTTARLEKRSTGKVSGESVKKIARVVTAYTITNVVAALIESGFDAFRDDDDEEMDAAKFMEYYLKNFLTDMSISGKIPYVKEIVSIAQGFSSSRSDTQWMQTFLSVISNVFKMSQGDGNPSKLLRDGIKLSSFVSGLPFYNVYRDMMAALDKLDILTAEDLEEMLEDLFG